MIAQSSKWLLASILISTLAVGGCSGSGSSDKAATDTGSVGNSSSEKPKDTITYKLLMNQNIPEYPADGGEGKQILLDAAAKAGVTGVDFQATMAGGSSSDYLTKLNLLASSGSLPDVFQVDEQTLDTFVLQGLVLPLDELLKKAPDLMKVIPKQNFEPVTFNGKMYGIPNGILPGEFNTPNVTGLFVRQDWMNKLGLKTPNTLDELEKVLLAFKDADPDGNSKKDTIPLEGYEDYQFDQIFGAYGIAPTHWQVNNGKIQKGFTLPGTKQALSTLQKWYKEGLIDPQFPVLTQTAANANLTNSKAAVMVQRSFVMNSFNPIHVALAKANANAQLALIPPPMGPNGQRGYGEENSAGGHGGYLVFSKNIKDPARFMAFLNWMATPDGFDLTSYGVKGKDFNFDEKTNTITQVTNTADLYKRGLSNPVRFFFAVDQRNTEPAFRQAASITSKYVIPNALWKSVPAEKDYPDLEAKLWPEYFVKIVTGEWPVDKWVEFVTKYYAQGGKTIEQQANDEWKQLQH